MTSKAIYIAWVVMAVLLPGGCAGAVSGGLVDPAAPVIENAPTGQAALLSASCSGCHMDGGEAIASLAGYDAASVEMRLLSYKSSDGETVMHRLARSYSDEQIREIAAYLGQESS